MMMMMMMMRYVSVKRVFAGVVIVLVTVLLCFFSSLFVLSRFMIGYLEPIRTFLILGHVAVCLIFAISLATCRKYRVRVGSLILLILARMVLYYPIPTGVLIVQCYQH